MNLKTVHYGLLLLVWISLGDGWAQPVAAYFTLKEAVQYGVQHHLTIQKSDYELEKYTQKYRAELSRYLPQIKADAAYINNLKLITQIIPGEFLGQPGRDLPVQFGTKYNASANLDLSQTLLDFEKITGQKMAKQQAKLGVLDKQKTVEQIVYDIANAYTFSQVAFLQQGEVRSNILKIDSLITTLQSRVYNGFANSIDLKRLQLERANLQTRHQNAELDYQQNLTLLKYAMAYPLEQAIRIQTKPEQSTLSGLADENLPATSLDLRILTELDQLTTLSEKQLRQSYLPKLSFTFKYGTLAQQNSPNVFASTGNWYPNSLASLTFSIPLFDGNYKLAKIRQLQLEHRQNELDIRLQQNSLAKEITETKGNLAIRLANVATTKESKRLAEEVFALSYIQFQNGYSSLKELLDTNAEVTQSQTAYLRAILALQSAELELLKTSGAIQTLLK